jgi:hypothetical protein
MWDGRASCLLLSTSCCGPFSSFQAEGADFLSERKPKSALGFFDFRAGGKIVFCFSWAVSRMSKRKTLDREITILTARGKKVVDSHLIWGLFATATPHPRSILLQEQEYLQSSNWWNDQGFTTANLPELAELYHVQQLNGVDLFVVMLPYSRRLLRRW